MKQRGGFTMPEAVIAVAISMLALAATLTSFLMFGMAAESSSTYNRLHAEARHAFDIVERDLHTASGVAAYASVQDITITAMTAAGVQDIRYYLSGAEFHRVVDTVDTVLAVEVEDVSFILYSVLGKPTAVPSEAYGVEFNLELETGLRGKLHTDTMTTAVRMRNKL